MSDPSQAWPHYYPDPPQYPCVDDHHTIHEGDDELEACEGCTPQCPDCSLRSECQACGDDRRFHEDRDNRLEQA